MTRTTESNLIFSLLPFSMTAALLFALCTGGCASSPYSPTNAETKFAGDTAGAYAHAVSAKWDIQQAIDLIIKNKFAEAAIGQLQAFLTAAMNELIVQKDSLDGLVKDNATLHKESQENAATITQLRDKVVSVLGSYSYRIGHAFIIIAFGFLALLLLKEILPVVAGVVPGPIGMIIGVVGKAVAIPFKPLEALASNPATRAA